LLVQLISKINELKTKLMGSKDPFSSTSLLVPL
jgi:hypothetical protein